MANQMRSRASSLPTGTLTFLFTDMEGSTRLLTALGPAFGPVLERHQALLRAAFSAAGGFVVSTEGDSFFVVFESAGKAVSAAADAQRRLAVEPWPSEVASVHVRMGLHTGEATLGGDNYVGMDVHRAARIAAAANGSQVLMSSVTTGLVRRSLPADLELRELGEFRLKDLEVPERLAQLVGTGLTDDRRAPRTLDTPSNLPPQATSFVGRERETAEVVELVRQSRLVTLTGPGGTGKTRLSLRVADRLTPEFPGGVFFVDLAPISDTGLIPTTIAQAIGLREDPKRPVAEQVEAHLRDLHVLLVLDNFEQLVSGASLVGRLLQAAPRLAILATSREVLHVRGEQEFPVPTLAVPDPGALPPLESLTKFDAVALFIQRARAVQPDFQLDAQNASAVASICARLDGLALAIELAAARSKLFGPEAILARLEKSLTLLTSSARDVPERQRTLRGAIDWSHDLLHAPERALVRRLAIFVGGCMIESAVAVCDPDDELGIDMLDALASLVDKSLLRQIQTPDGEPRFLMLETIREYGLERLAESGEAELVRHRHEEHFATLVREAEPELAGPRSPEWLGRLEAERDNVRAAIQRAADDGRIDLALDVAAPLWRYWQQRGHLVEGNETLRGLLDRPEAAARTGARARALGGLGGVAYWQADIPLAGQAYAEALEIERRLDDPSGLAGALYNAGFVTALMGDRAGALADYEEAIRIYEAVGDDKSLVNVREGLVFVLYHAGDYTQARAIQEANLVAFRKAGQTSRIANALSLLSVIKMKDGDFRATRADLAQAVASFRASGDMHRIVNLVIISAALANAEGDPRRAAVLSGAAATLKQPLGEIATPMQLLGMEDPAVKARAALGDDDFESGYRAGRALSLDETVQLVQAHAARP